MNSAIKVSLLLLSAAAAANASSIVVSTIISPEKYGSFGDLPGIAPIQYLGALFTPTTTLGLLDAKAVLYDGGIRPSVIKFDIYSDLNGLPESLLVSLGTVICAPSVPDVYSASDLSAPFTLQAGTKYWLVLSPAVGFASWVGGGSPQALSAASYGGWHRDGLYSPQFQIDGVSNAPEPGTAALFFLSSGVVSLLFRRSRFLR